MSVRETVTCRGRPGEDDVEVRQLAELLERVLDVGVLEVQRQRLARVLPVVWPIERDSNGSRCPSLRLPVLLGRERLGGLEKGRSSAEVFCRAVRTGAEAPGRRLRARRR